MELRRGIKAAPRKAANQVQQAGRTGTEPAAVRPEQIRKPAQAACAGGRMGMLCVGKALDGEAMVAALQIFSRCWHEFRPFRLRT